MFVVEVNDRPITLTESGWLSQLSDWNPDVAEEVARHSNVAMTEEHWQLVMIARSYYLEYGRCIEPRTFTKMLKRMYGPERSDQKYIYSLFPLGGLGKCINKIAGLPCPSGCD